MITSSTARAIRTGITRLLIGAIADGEYLRRSGATVVGGPGGAAGIGGSTGATDNAILRADGTGGATLQNSGVLINDSNKISAPTQIAVGTQTGFDADYSTGFYFNNSALTVGMLNVLQGAEAKAPIVSKIEDNNTSGNLYGLISIAVAAHPSGTKGYTIAVEGDVYSKAAGNLGKLLGLSGFAEHDGSGTVTLMASLYATGNWRSAGIVTKNAGLWVESQTGVGSSNFGIWLDDQGSNATDYAFWHDSPGVFRIKGDGIMAYYNPAFTKYTPAAASYERIVQQWVSNVAQIGTEVGAGGGNVLRKLQLIGGGLILSTDILPTANPTVAGQLWNDSGTLKVSAG